MDKLFSEPRPLDVACCRKGLYPLAAFERRYNWNAMEPRLLKTYRDLAAKYNVHGNSFRDE